MPEEHVHKHALGPFVVGLAIHNLADGFVLGVGAKAAAVTSWLVGLGVLVHQMPVGISLAAVLLAARVGRAGILDGGLARPGDPRRRGVDRPCRARRRRRSAS